jgi:hypothetical protein
VEIIRNPNVTRFGQLQPGELFFFAHQTGLCVALAVSDPANDGDKLAVPLGPIFPAAISCPTLMELSGTTVISFAKNYLFRLPASADGWLVAEPPPERTCFLVTDDGIYLRANFAPRGSDFRPCYIDITSGVICADQSRRQYTRPRGIPAFAVRWEILTDEKEPRLIMSSQ